MSAPACLSVVLFASLVSCGSPPPRPPAPAAPVVVEAPSAVPPRPAPPPPALVVLTPVRSGAVVDVAEADAVRVLPGSDEGLKGVAHFPGAVAAAIHAGVELELVHSLNPYVYGTVRVTTLEATPDGGVDAAFESRRFAPATRLERMRQPGIIWRAYARTGSREGRPVLRADAVRHEGKLAYVLRLSHATPPTVERVRVTVGSPVEPRPGLPNRDVEITAGLAPGDAVVLDGPLELRDGDAVQAAAPPPRVTGNPKDECNPARFVAQPDGMVLDTRLRITWQRALSPAEMTYADAASLCLGRRMRLPTRPEVETFYEDEMHPHECAMESRGESFWTGSPGEYPDSHWLLYPRGSGPSSAGGTTKSLVRCVRDVGAPR